jgi:uncharacterized protein YjdB
MRFPHKAPCLAPKQPVFAYDALRRRSGIVKYNSLALAVVIAITSLNCGGGGPKLERITVAPSSATATSSPQSQVAFAATGALSNDTTRALAPGDGLIWASSNTAVATINTNGTATCLAPGTVTITATAPQNLSKGSTGTAVSGTATLTCT